MALFTYSLAILSVGLLLGGLRLWRLASRSLLEIASGHRAALQELGLTGPEHFLALGGVVVGGHSDRQAVRLQLGTLPLILKRERHTGWLDRLISAWAGFGLVSRCVREGRILQALQREGLPGPEWVACGQEGGCSFLLIRTAPGCDLRTLATQERDPVRRLRLARQLGRVLARLHAAGWTHGDLYAKHVLVHEDELLLLDWPRARRQHCPTWTRRAEDLAALHATLLNDLATRAERLACLRAYLACEPAGVLGPFHRLVVATAARLLHRRHVAEKRLAQPAGPGHAWVCRDGEDLCVQPALADLWPGLDPRTLVPVGVGQTRRWLCLPGGGQALLVSRPWPLREVMRAWFGAKPRRGVEHEQAGRLGRLERLGVSAPRVLALGRVRGGTFLLTRPEPTVQLDAWLTRHGPTQRQQLLHNAGRLLRRLHEVACYLGQETLAVCCAPEVAPTVALVGADGLDFRRRPDAARASQEREACTARLTQAGWGSDEVSSFLAGYGPLEPTMPPVSVAEVSIPAPPAAQEVPVPRVGLWQRLVRGMRRLRQRPDWPIFAGTDWPERIMDLAVTDRYHAKQGRSTGRLILAGASGGGRSGNLTVYLKRHYHLPWWRGLLATLWPGGNWSPALQEWEHLEWARRQGVPVPNVVAAAEFIGPGCRLRSILAVEELSNMLPLHEAVPVALAALPPDAFRCWKQGLVTELARLARLLHDRHVFHKDLYLCHFYIDRGDLTAVPADWRGRVCLIDLHRLTHHPWSWRLWQLKDLAQLLYSSDLAGIDDRDRLLFWREYRGPGPRRPPRPWLRWLILFKWRQYQRHNARKLVDRSP